MLLPSTARLGWIILPYSAYTTTAHISTLVDYFNAKPAMSSSSKRCHSCRRSRLRCDGRQPTCLKCDSRGVECLGYGTQPFLWIQPRGPVVPTSAVSNNESGTISLAVKRKGRPKLVLMQSSKDRCPVELTSGSNCHLDLTDKRVHRPKGTAFPHSPPAFRCLEFYRTIIG